jgi:hypothetical protein
MPNESFIDKSKTEVLYGIESSLDIGIKFMQKANTIDVAADKKGPAILIEYDVYKKNLIDARNRGAKMRYLVDITQENLNYCKEMLKIANEIRHFEGFKGGLAVSDVEYMGTPSLTEKQHSVFLIYSNEKEIVDQQQIIFNTLWEKAIPAKQRIKEIETGIKREFIETIREPFEIQKLFFKLLKSAEEEILLLLSTSNTFYKLEKLGLISLLHIIAKPSLNIQILTSIDSTINNKIINLNNAFDNKSIFYPLKKSDNPQPNIICLIIDSSFSLVIDIKDDSHENFEDSIGLCTYSNVDSIVDTYVSLFERSRIQTELL